MFLQTKVSRVLWSAVKDHASQFQCICGVPYTALPIATVQEHIYSYANLYNLIIKFYHYLILEWGVPYYLAFILLQVISVEQNVPMLVRRKEAKDYGTKVLLSSVR